MCIGITLNINIILQPTADLSKPISIKFDLKPKAPLTGKKQRLYNFK